MGPTLARMAARAAGTGRRVIAVSRWSSEAAARSARAGRRRDHQRRSPRPRRRRRASRCAERRLHGGPEVRHDRRTGDDVGNEHRRSRELRRALPRLAHRRVLDGKRLLAHANVARRDRARPTRSVRSASTRRRASAANASSSSTPNDTERASRSSGSTTRSIFATACSSTLRRGSSAVAGVARTWDT